MVDSSPSLLHEPQPAELDLESAVGYCFNPSYRQHVTTLTASYYSETSEQTYYNICADGTTFINPANQQYWQAYSRHHHHTAAYRSAYDNTSATYGMPSYATGNHYPQIGHGQPRRHYSNSNYHIEDGRNNYITREKNWNKGSKYQGDVKRLPLVLNVEAVITRADCRTSLMIRNIPNK